MNNRLYELMNDAANYYSKCLYSREGKEILEFLTENGVNGDGIKKFRIGASTSCNGVIKELDSKYTLKEMQEVAIIDCIDGEWIDVNYRRIMIPIVNIADNVVSFVSRKIDKESSPTYRNGTPSGIFDKTQCLFGINLAKQKSYDVDYVIVVEGFFDAILMHQAGFVTTVSGMGTSLTFGQADLIKSICPNVYLCYDGDIVGQKAAERAYAILSSKGLNVKRLHLPNGKDLIDIIKNNGKEYFEILLKEVHIQNT